MKIFNLTDYTSMSSMDLYDELIKEAKKIQFSDRASKITTGISHNCCLAQVEHSREAITAILDELKRRH